MSNTEVANTPIVDITDSVNSNSKLELTMESFDQKLSIHNETQIENVNPNYNPYVHLFCIKTSEILCLTVGLPVVAITYVVYPDAVKKLFSDFNKAKDYALCKTYYREQWENYKNENRMFDREDIINELKHLTEKREKYLELLKKYNRYFGLPDDDTDIYQFQDIMHIKNNDNQIESKKDDDESIIVDM